ncbi:MAG: hypothetical protein EOO77_21285 [Oxalobacteraceae bacterium]|nr:MAG: hypothetical protein EOO77_21285 [Oxalobacteraceae bacterium]
MKEYFKAAQKQGDRLADVLSDKVTASATRELMRILNRWHRLYPRHQFRAFQGHGMLSIEVKPQIGMVFAPKHHRTADWQRLDRVDRRARQGAIRLLCNEADAICTAWAGLEWRTGTAETEIMQVP